MKTLKCFSYMLFYFLEKSSFIFKTIMVSVFCHIFILLNIFLKMEIAFPVSAVTITIPEHTHTHKISPDHHKMQESRYTEGL